MTHIQALARQMADRGTTHVFGIPGSGPSLDLLDALEKNGVRFQLTHFEGSGAIMAGAVGKLSGRSGAALSIKGPGLTNLLPGLAACRLEAFPVVSIAEAYPPDAPQHQTHKRLNHADLLSAVVKKHFFLSAEGPGYEHLAGLAEAEMPGVVHLDIAGKPGPPAAVGAPAPSMKSSDGDWARLVRLVAQAQRPVIIAGTLAVRKALHTRFKDLRFPVFSTAAAKGVVDERLPQAAGVYTGVGGPLAPETALLHQADLVVGIGIRHNEVLAARPFSCPAVNIDPLGETHSFGFKFQYTAPGADPQLETLFEQLSEKAWGLDPLQRCLASLRARMLTADFLPANVYVALAAHFKNKARLVLDTGNFCTIGEHAWDVPSPGLYLASGQGRYMGVGLPLALGAALYDASVPTVVFCGDGGIGMFVAEIKIAVQHCLPLIVVLMSDGHLGTIRGGAIQKHLTQQPAFIARPSWLDAFEGLGIGGVRIESEGALETALGGWSMDSGPLYLEAIFDPDAYQRMTEGIR